MGIVVILTLLVALMSVKTDFGKNSIHEDYMSIEHTNAIKGIFVIFIILTHFQQYVPETWARIDYPFIFIREYIGQLVVAPFLFVSGYGVYKSYEKKGVRYITSFPKYRLLKTLLHFDIGVLLFILVDIILGDNYSLIEYITALTGWNSIGNSNWYIFAILCMYVVTWASGLFTKTTNTGQEKRAFVIGVTIGVFVYISIISRFKGPVFYNTSICYPIGMWYAMYEKKIKKHSRKLEFWLVEICLLGGGIIIAYLKSPIYSLKAAVFPLLIFIFTMRCCVNSKILKWFGKHIFSIYMLQRLPMIILSHAGFQDISVLLYLGCTLIITVLIAWWFDIAMYRLDTLLQLRGV